MDYKERIIAYIGHSQKMNAAILKYYAPLCLLAGVGLAAWIAVRSQAFYAGDTQRQPLPGWTWGLAGLLLFFGSRLLISAVKKRKEKLLLTYIQSQPEKIVWIYRLNITVNTVRNEHLVLGDDNGQRYQLPVFRENGKEDAYMDALTALFPHAVTGYSYERNELFRHNPGALKNMAQRQG